MDLYQAQPYWLLDLLPFEALPAIASNSITRGCSGRATAALANAGDLSGEESPLYRELDLVGNAIWEAGAGALMYSDAWRLVVRDTIQQLMSGAADGIQTLAELEWIQSRPRDPELDGVLDRLRRELFLWPPATSERHDSLTRLVGHLEVNRHKPFADASNAFRAAASIANRWSRSARDGLVRDVCARWPRTAISWHSGADWHWTMIAYDDKVLAAIRNDLPLAICADGVNADLILAFAEAGFAIARTPDADERLLTVDPAAVADALPAILARPAGQEYLELFPRYGRLLVDFCFDLGPWP